MHHFPSTNFHKDLNGQCENSDCENLNSLIHHYYFNMTAAPIWHSPRLCLSLPLASPTCLERPRPSTNLKLGEL